jgi:hypothetical protein
MSWVCHCRPPVALLNETSKGRNGEGKQKLRECLLLLYCFAFPSVILKIKIVVFWVVTPCSPGDEYNVSKEYATSIFRPRTGLFLLSLCNHIPLKKEAKGPFWDKFENQQQCRISLFQTILNGKSVRRMLWTLIPGK